MVFPTANIPSVDGFDYSSKQLVITSIDIMLISRRGVHPTAAAPTSEVEAVVRSPTNMAAAKIAAVGFTKWRHSTGGLLAAMFVGEDLLTNRWFQTLLLFWLDVRSRGEYLIYVCGVLSRIRRRERCESTVWRTLTSHWHSSTSREFTSRTWELTTSLTAIHDSLSALSGPSFSGSRYLRPSSRCKDTLFDPVCHVSSRSGEACCELLYPVTYLLYFTICLLSVVFLADGLSPCRRWYTATEQ